MSVPVRLTKQTTFDTRRTPISKDSDLHSSLLMSSPLGPSLRSESRERCARFLVSKDLNLAPELVTKIKVPKESTNDENETKDPFANHQFAFKLVKKDFTGKKKTSPQTNSIRGLKTLENVAMARKLRAAIEEQQDDNKPQFNQTQKENECSFLMATDKSRPGSRLNPRIQTPEFKLNFGDKQSQTAKIIKQSSMESFYTPKERESAILSVKRTFESGLKEIPEKVAEASQGLNAAQSKISKLMLRISSASSCKNLNSHEFFNSELLRAKASAKNKDTSIHIKRSATPSVRLRTRLVVNSRPDTSLDRFSSNRLDSTQKVKQVDAGSKDNLSWARETTDHTPSGTKTDTISSRIFVQENAEKKAYMSVSIQELPSLNTSMHMKADIGPSKTCVSGSRSKVVTREVSRQFETLAESLVMKNDRKSTEGVRKTVEEESQKKGGDVNLEEEIEKREKELTKRLLRDGEEKDEVVEGPKIPIKQRNIMRVSSAKQEDFRSKIVEECNQANTELNQLTKKVNDILDQKEAAKNQPKKNINFASGSSNILNEIEIGFIREEYEKKAEGVEAVDYEKIESLVSRLKYFSRLPQDIRMGLLKNGAYEYYESGSTIFKQGDIGDVMYVILRGSVNIRMTKKTSFGVLENSIVATLYDGIHFGEYTITSANMQQEDQKGTAKETSSRPLTRLKTFGFGEQTANMEEVNKEEEPITYDYIKEGSFNEIKTPEALTFSQRGYHDKPRRMATAQAAESCDILCIPRDRFQDVFLNLMQKEVDDKVKILSELSFFSKLDPVELMPLANNLTSKAYKMGEVIQAAGEPVEKFRLIVSGRCQAAIGVTKKRDTVQSKGLTSRVASAKNLHRGLNDSSFRETQAKLDAIHLLGSKNEDNPPSRRVYENRAFNFEQLGTKGGQVLYVEHVCFDTLSRGKFIGGRALLTEKDFPEEADILTLQFRLNSLAKISLVADTPNVEVLEIAPDRLKYIPESLLKIFKQGLMATKEFDDYNIEHEVRLNKKWSEFKESQVAEIVKSRVPTKRSVFKVC